MRILFCFIFFVYFICLVVSGLSAQNWDINTLHRVNSWDGKFVRNYNKIISRSEPYVAVGVPVAMAVAAWIKHDKGLLKDAVYVGTSVAGAFVVTYGMKYLVDRERPYDKYPDRVHAYSHEGSPSFPSGHTAIAFASAEFLRHEYKDDPWIGYAGYAVATATGLLRMYNNKHYLGDIVAGAGFGIASAKLSYFLYDKVFFKNGWHFTLTPVYNNKNISLAYTYQF